MNGNSLVLIVDDHASLSRSLVSLLSASGFEAQAVHTGAEALAFVRSHEELALVLLDMSLPDMSGFEVLRTMRASVHPQSPPVVIFSIDDDPAIRDKAMQLGATDFASKGKPADLLRVVASYVRPTKPPHA